MELMALESFQGDVATVGSVLSRVRTTGKVCRKDMEPYINHMPIHYTLNSFTEEPSEQNVEMATEAMAMLFKIAVGVALGAVIGAVIFLLVRSKNSSDATRNNADQLLREIALVESLEKAQDVAPDPHTLSAVDSAKIPRDLGVSQHGKVTFSEAAEAPLDVLRGLLDTKVNQFAYDVRGGKFQPFSRTTIPQMKDLLSEMAKRVKTLDSLFSNVEKETEANRLDTFTDKVYEQIASKERETLINMIKRYYDRDLPPHSRAEQIEGTRVVDTSTVLAEMSGQCLAIIRERTGKVLSGDKVNEICEQAKSNQLTASLIEMKAVATELVKGEAVQMNSLLRSLQDDFKALEARNKAVQLPEQLERAFSVLLEAIRRDLASVEAFIDAYTLEIESLLTMAKVLAQYTSNDTKLVSVFVKDEAVPADVRRRFEQMVEKALKDHKGR